MAKIDKIKEGIVLSNKEELSYTKKCSEVMGIPEKILGKYFKSMAIDNASEEDCTNSFEAVPDKYKPTLLLYTNTLTLMNMSSALEHLKEAQPVLFSDTDETHSSKLINTMLDTTQVLKELPADSLLKPQGIFLTIFTLIQSGFISAIDGMSLYKEIGKIYGFDLEMVTGLSIRAIELYTQYVEKLAEQLEHPEDVPAEQLH